MWWWFEYPLIIDSFEGSILGILLCTTQKFEHQERLITVFPFGTSDGQHIDSMGWVSFSDLMKLNGKQSGPENSPKYTNLLRFIITGLLWLEQKIIIEKTVEPERHVRKRLIKAGHIVSSIRIVTLRKEIPQISNNHKDVEWSCQWLVNGHWRQQYYPSTKERKPKWILPYVKGPEDKPFKEIKPVVFAVVR